MIRAGLGFLRGDDRLILRLTGADAGVMSAAHPDLNRVPADRRGIDDHGAEPAPPITRSGGRGLGHIAHAFGGLEHPGQQPGGVGRHLTQTGLGLLRERHSSGTSFLDDVDQG